MFKISSRIGIFAGYVFAGKHLFVQQTESDWHFLRRHYPDQVRGFDLSPANIRRAPHEIKIRYFVGMDK